MLSVNIIPLLRDNYSYLVIDLNSGITAVIDPGSTDPILQYIGEKKLDYILNTHHHWDHTDGNLSIKDHKQAKIIGSELDKDRIPGIDIYTNDQFKLGASTVDVLNTPGHTWGHISFFFRKDKILFCGDTLFSAGCGRIFEGTIEQMYDSLQLLKKLPNNTKIYCGHEYTAYNLRFALSIEPQNICLQSTYKVTKQLRKQYLPTMPSTIAHEKRINPFFRTESEEIRKNINMLDNTNLEVFTKLRLLKNSF